MRKLFFGIGVVLLLLVLSFFKPAAVEACGAYVVAVYGLFVGGNSAVHIGREHNINKREDNEYSK